MATPCFYHPDLELESESEQLTLMPSEASHAIKSRRLGVGQGVNLINGVGLFAKARIIEVENRTVRLVVDKVESHSRKSQFAIATAIPKRDRQKVMIDMLTQLGVSEIIPLSCEHSVTRFKPNMHEKWHRVAIESCKQSQNPWLPKIHEEISVNDLIDIAGARLLVADAQSALFHDQVKIVQNPIVMIGPEGGFSLVEKSFFANNDIKFMTLGHNILRTETAAITAAALSLSMF